MENKEWYISAYALDDVPTSDHLKLRSVSLPIDDSMPDRHVAVQILWLSIDPYLRTLMAGRADGLYLPQFELGQVISSAGLGKVIKSTDSKYKVYSDLEVAFIISEEEAILKALSKTVEILEGNTAPIRQYYYGCLFHELLAFQLADRHPPTETLRRLAQNREAARKSRLRKKAYVQQLETSRIKLSQLE